MEFSLFTAVLCAVLLAVLVGVFLIWRQLKLQNHDKQELAQLTAAFNAANERLERELRNAISESARGGRQELIQTLGTFQQSLVQQSAEATRTQNSQMDAFAQQLSMLQKHCPTRSLCKFSNFQKPMHGA